jgi:hypothetical protein
MPMPIESRPVPPPAPKPRGFFGREFGQIAGAVRDDKYFRSAGPNYSRQWVRDERETIIKDAGKLSGKAYLNKDDIPQIIEKMKQAKWDKEKIEMFKSLVEDK